MVNSIDYNSKIISKIENNLGIIGSVKKFPDNIGLFHTKGAGWNNDLDISIMELPEYPTKEITAFTTCGLSRYPLTNPNNKEVKYLELVMLLRNDTNFLELTGDLENGVNFCEDGLSYISHYLVNESDFITSGELWINWFSNKGYEQFSDLKHLYFMNPSLFNLGFNNEVIEGNNIEWLLLVPITQKELEYYEEKGSRALEELLLHHNLNVSDLFRRSLI